MPDEAPLPLFPLAPRTPPLRTVARAELEAVIVAAIRAGAAGSLSRGAELLLACVCARTIADRIGLAGLLVVRPDVVSDV